MEAYPLAAMLTVRRYREESAKRRVRSAEVAVREAEENVEKTRRELDEFRVWRKQEEDRRYEAIMNVPVSLEKLELFKAGHHGSPTSSNDCLLSVIRPKAVVVCCCAGTDEYTKDPDNQFPSQAFVDRVCAYTQNVYCTNVVSENEDGYEPMNGDIVFYSDDSGSDGAGIKLWCSDNTLKLKDTDWFKACRTCPEWGWTAADREAFVSSSGG